MKIKVGGVDYSVNKVPFVEINGSRDFLGLCDYYKSVIEYDTALKLDRKGQVVIHELVHAIFHEAGFNAQEEDTVNRLGIVLHQVIKDNDLRELLKKL